MRYFINTICRDHVRIGVEGEFTQANHGKSTKLKQLKQGDMIAFYSPRISYPDGEALQAFTAIGQVADDKLYQVEMSPDFLPRRRNLTFFDCEEAPIKPLIDDLNFIQNKQRWGYLFRFGLFEIPQQDFELICKAMHVAEN